MIFAKHKAAERENMGWIIDSSSLSTAGWQIDRVASAEAPLKGFYNRILHIEHIGFSVGLKVWSIRFERDPSLMFFFDPIAAGKIFMKI